MSEWLPDGTWRDPDCIECGGEGAPCCEPPDHPPPAAPAEFELELPYPSPPLNLNHRHNRWQHAALVKQLRHDAWALALQARIGRHDRVDVALHWRPARRGTYDEDNPTPTLKACADGLVDAGVTADDDHTRMAKRVVIHPAAAPARLWLVVTPLPVTP